MVKRPRQVMRYSPSAGKHTSTRLSVSRKSEHLNFAGVSDVSARMAGYRGFPRPKPDGREKPTKRQHSLPVHRDRQSTLRSLQACQEIELVDR